MVSIAFPAFNYKYAYIHKIEIVPNGETKEIVLQIIGNNQSLVLQNHFSPVSPIGISSVKIDIEAMKKLLSSHNPCKGQDGCYPIIYTINSRYGSVPRSRIHVALLTGLSFAVNTDSSRLFLLLGHSQASRRVNNGWATVTSCKGEPCKLYLYLVVDESIVAAIDEARQKAGCNNGCKFRVKVFDIDAGDVQLYLFRLRDVRTFLRSYSFINDINPVLSEKYPQNLNVIEISLSEADVETVYVGSQIVAKGFGIDMNTGKMRSMFYTSPLVIAYPMSVPNGDLDKFVGLPLDRILRTGVIRLSFESFGWNNAVRLIDWLWDHHRDSVFKLLLSRPVVEGLLSLSGVGYVRGLYNLETSVVMNLYGHQIVTYSPSITKLVKAYYDVRPGGGSDLLDVVKKYLVELSFGELDEKLLKELQLEDVKRLLSVFALIYGLHGISHLLMKALTMITGLPHYGEFISVTVDVDSLENEGLNRLANTLRRISSESLIHEGLYMIGAGGVFELRVDVFSRVPFSLSSFRYALRKVDNGAETLDVSLIQDMLKRVLARGGVDTCARQWGIEKKLLVPHRQVLRHDPELSQADDFIKTSIEQMFKPHRSLFRFLYDYRLSHDILDFVVGERNKHNHESRKTFLKRLNSRIQYIWPYHLPRCVDGCYGCVLMERSTKSSTCDLTPLTQELRISKWAALCLLKYAGLINFDWVDCSI